MQLVAHYYHCSAEVALGESVGILSSIAVACCFSVSSALAWLSFAIILWWQQSCGAENLNDEATLSMYWSLCIQTQQPSVVFAVLSLNWFMFAKATTIIARTGI